ncbi:MAG: aminoacyl-tRNA hydrolase [Proteobacteria bacterium]|nr:aminoacyl-tRNA hydrolase [Pseudomonadota bacterium]MBU1714549.1 aminoacyl-tRNA hydrolase [Pseudomonadota bacterium]
MFLVVGLGNPGLRYTGTRHNIGFMFLDKLAERHSLSWRDSKWQANVVKSSLWGKPLVLAKPSTFMNLSGVSVSSIANFYQIPAGNIIVVHDDLDLPVGRIKIVCRRGAGGHNGIKSIIEQMGTNDFVRLRVGIGRPHENMDVSAFVLSKFSNKESQVVETLFDDLETVVETIVEQGVTLAMNRFNTLKDSAE